MTIQNEKGFTLVEIIVSIFILSIGILAVASMQGMSLKGDAFAQNKTEGATWQQDKIEELMAMPYDSLNGAVGSTTTPTGYILTVAIADGTVADTKKITVAAQDPQGRPLPTLICVRSKLLK